MTIEGGERKHTWKRRNSPRTKRVGRELRRWRAFGPASSPLQHVSREDPGKDGGFREGGCASTVSPPATWDRKRGVETSLPGQARTGASQGPADGFLARPPPIGPLNDARKTRGPELRRAPALGVGPPRVARGRAEKAFRRGCQEGLRELAFPEGCVGTWSGGHPLPEKGIASVKNRPISSLRARAAARPGRSHRKGRRGRSRRWAWRSGSGSSGRRERRAPGPRPW